MERIFEIFINAELFLLLFPYRKDFRGLSRSIVEYFSVTKK